MCRVIVLSVLSWAAFCLGAIAEQSPEIECGGFYSVQPGDTLRIISAKAYGVRDKAAGLYTANADVVGADPSAIKVGQRLNIPCMDREAGEPSRRPVRVAIATTPLAAIGGADCQVETDSLSGQGMSLQVMLQALSFSASKRRISYNRTEADVAATVQAAAEADLSVPWLKPACADEGLTTAETRLCEDFLWSDPLFVMVRGVFVRRSDGNNAGAVALAPSRICKVQSVGRSGANERHATIDQCLRDLLLGEADAVSAPIQEAYEAIRAKGLDAAVVEAPEKAVSEPVYTITNRSGSDAKELFARLNSGLAAMNQNGDLFQIATSYFYSSYIHGADCTPTAVELSGLKP
ncbi:MAG: LysM peptidoglycan-binding domain-containing protein [Pikeienuella sp.]